MKHYFLYDPDDGIRFFDTEEEMVEASKESMSYYFEDGTWDPDVVGIVGGIVTHRVKKSDTIFRPPEDELDEDGYDKNRIKWEEDFIKACNYKFVKVEDQ